MPTPTPSASATNAGSATVSGSVPKDNTTFDTAKAAVSIPTVITQLMVGCRRKVVIYTWKDGEAQEAKVCPPFSDRCDVLWIKFIIIGSSFTSLSPRYIIPFT
jgi:hypothetical protein